MKFAEHLAAHITPTWRKQYINYEDMKTMLNTAVEKAPSVDGSDQEELKKYYSRFDEQFFRVCDKELSKINIFFSEKLAEATRKFSTLTADLQAAKEQNGDGFKKRKPLDLISRGKQPARKMPDLKLAFSEFYLSLILLQSYQNLNQTGFRKILKKHDKLLTTNAGDIWNRENVETASFVVNKDIDKLIAEVENTVTTELESGDRTKAMKRLRVPPLEEAQSPWTTFKVGLFSGAFIVLLVAVLLSAILSHDHSQLWLAVRLFRGPLWLIMFLFLIGINVYGWRSSGVNHVLIFEIDPRNHLTEQNLIEIAAIFGVIWALSLLGFLYAESLSIPPYTVPLSLLVFMVFFLLNPSRTFYHEARFWLVQKLGRVMVAPLARVQFADFWLADQLNTLVSVLVDFEYTICFYMFDNVDWNRPSSENKCLDKKRILPYVVNCLPAWFRFAQCIRRYRDSRDMFPHLANAFKYASTFFVVIFTYLVHMNPDQYPDFGNPYFYMLIFSRICNSSFVLWWDLKMDWSVFDFDRKNKEDGKKIEHKYLREEMVYSSPYYYYFAIVEDVLLRFSWVVSMTLTKYNLASDDSISTVLVPLEIFRRFIWNFFRLENEHINNCGQFRAVRDISIIPIDASDQAQLLKMMDEEDGVVNRRKKKAGGGAAGGGGGGGGGGGSKLPMPSGGIDLTNTLEKKRNVSASVPLTTAFPAHGR